jgi:hypothetical protein
MKDYRIKFDDNYKEVGSLLEKLGYKNDKDWNTTVLMFKDSLTHILTFGGDSMKYFYVMHSGFFEYTDITIEQLRELVKQTQ